MEGEGSMRKTYTRFEQVPVTVVEKIIQLQESMAKHDGNRKPAVRKSGRAANGRHAAPKKVEVLIP
jgi:hypothetical protein